MKKNKLLVQPIAKSDIALELLDTKSLLKVVSDRLQTVDEEFTEYREENKDKIEKTLLENVSSMSEVDQHLIVK